MSAANAGIPLSSKSRLTAALVPPFSVHLADWMESQRATASEAHEAVPYLERLDLRATAEDTLNFVMGFFRPGLSPTPLSEVGDLLGGLALVLAEIAGAPPTLTDEESKRIALLIGTKLIELFAESSRLILVRATSPSGPVFMLNPETTRREPVEIRRRPVERSESDISSPRTERMLRALRDMRDRRMARAACF